MNARSAGSEVAQQPRTAGSRPPQPEDQPVIALRNAAAERDGRRLWGGLDLTVAAGEFVAVLGPNGVGKSTLVQIILGALPLAEGEVRVLGQPPGRANRRIGYLPQRRSFDPSLRVRGRDIVRLGVDGHRWACHFLNGYPAPRRGARRRGALRRSST